MAVLTTLFFLMLAIKKRFEFLVETMFVRMRHYRQSETEPVVHEMTTPVVEYYRGENKLIEVDGENQ